VPFEEKEFGPRGYELEELNKKAKEKQEADNLITNTVSSSIETSQLVESKVKYYKN
jgi:hypothetical protein